MKTDEQFAEDIAHGNRFELALWSHLSKYIYGLVPPVEAERLGNKVIGGFTYRPDMKAQAVVTAQGSLDERFYGETCVAIEAKIRLGQFKFTCADDFPFDDIICNEVYKTAPAHISWNDYSKLSLKDQLSYMRPFHSYWIANSEQTHVAVICPATKPLWFQRKTFSPKDRRVAMNWHCPIRKPDGKPAVFFGRFPDDVGHLLTRL